MRVVWCEGKRMGGGKVRIRGEGRGCGMRGEVKGTGGEKERMGK